MRYSVSVSKAGVNTAATTMVVLWNPTNVITVNEIGISIAVAPTTAPDWYIVRATARGTQTTTAAGSAYNSPAATSTGTVDSAWSGNPTVNAATTALRRLAMPVTAGGGVIYTFIPEAMHLPNGTGLAIVNANVSGATTGTMGFYFDWTE